MSYLNDVQEKYKKLGEELKSLWKENDNLRQEISDLSKENNILEFIIDEAESIPTNVINQRKSEMRKKKDLKEQLDRMKKRNETLEEQLDGAK